MENERKVVHFCYIEPHYRVFKVSKTKKCINIWEKNWWTGKGHTEDYEQKVKTNLEQHMKYCKNIVFGYKPKL